MLISERKYKGISITQPEHLIKVFKAVLEAENETDRDKEHFWTVGLTARNNIKYIDLVSLGILTGAIVHPRETFRLAVMKGVHSIMVIHNHPSGDPEPSEEDIRLTRRLVEAGRILGIELLDHIVIGENKEISFKGKGLL